MMIKRTITLDQQQEQFINHYAEFGFTDSNEMVREGLNLLKVSLDKQARLSESADLYAMVYAQDEELNDWTESAIRDWD